MMDIEGLTKSQIVLLTLLITFITSIATGIVTVTLLQQAPPGVTQVINRVVERTVERVVPAATSTQIASAGTPQTIKEKEVTVVVKEDDLITSAIEKNSKAIVHITKPESARNLKTPGDHVTIGFVLTAGGVVAADVAFINPSANYVITTSDGANYSAHAISNSAGGPVALLAMDRQPEDPPLQPVTLADLSGLKLGQTAIALSGGDRVNVAIGIVSNLETATAADGSTKLARVHTDIDSGRVVPGSPLFNMFGEVIGMYTTGLQENTASYYPLTPAMLSDISGSQAGATP